MVWRMFTVTLIVVGIGQCLAQELTPAQRFNRGKGLIAANCGDCQGSTRAGLELGLADVQAAVDAGYPDRSAALTVLADGLNTLQLVFAAPDSAERAQIGARKRAVYGELVRLQPKNPDVLYAYATAVEGDDAQIAAYQQVLAVAPRRVDARFALGMLLLRNSRTTEAVAALRQVVEGADARQVPTYAQEISQALRNAGRRADAEALEELARGRVPKA